MLLLKVCGIPRMNYLCRTVQPSALINTTRHFDSAVRETALLKLNLNPLTSEQQYEAYNQLTLPIRLGGSGFTVMNDIKHAAYIASVAHSHEFVAKTPTKELYTIVNTSSSIQLQSQINNSLQEIKQQICNSKAEQLLP